MTEGGYAIFSLSDTNWQSTESGAFHHPVTDDLNCTHTHVDYYRTSADLPAYLSSEREAVCIPLDGSSVLRAEKPLSVPAQAVVFKPHSVECHIHSEPDVHWIVVSTDANQSSTNSISLITKDALDFRKTGTSGVETAHLTDPLGCAGMKVNLRRIQTGQSIPYHTEGEQEELYVPLDGPGQVLVAGSELELEAGDVTRVDPTIPRAAFNHSEQARLWFMVGAPPTGDPYKWAPTAALAERSE